MTVRHIVSGIETTRLLFYSILFNSHVPFFCTSVTIFLCYLCPDEGLCKTETCRLQINYVPLTVDYCWFCFLLTLLIFNIEIDGRDGHNSYMNKDHIMTDNECDAGNGSNNYMDKDHGTADLKSDSRDESNIDQALL